MEETQEKHSIVATLPQVEIVKKTEDPLPNTATTVAIIEKDKKVTISDVVIVNEKEKTVRGVAFPIVSAIDKLQNAIDNQRINKEDIAELSRNVQRDCNGRTFEDIKKAGEDAYVRLSQSAITVLTIYLEKISKITAKDIANGQIMPVDIGLKTKFDCPTVSLGCSDKFPVSFPQTSGMVLTTEVNKIEKYILFKLRELYRDQPTDVIVEKTNPYYFDWGFTYITVFIINTTFVPNKYTPQNMERQILKTQYIIPITKSIDK